MNTSYLLYIVTVVLGASLAIHWLALCRASDQAELINEQEDIIESNLDACQLLLTLETKARHNDITIWSSGRTELINVQYGAHHLTGRTLEEILVQIDEANEL